VGEAIVAVGHGGTVHFLFSRVKTPSPPLRSLKESLHRRPFLGLNREQPLQLIGRKVAFNGLANEITQGAWWDRIEFDGLVAAAPIARPPIRDLCWTRK
jgi:hypothetical protein